MHENFKCKALQWDTEYFGVNSARVNLINTIDDSDKDNIIEFCKSYEFITILNVNNDNENNRWLGGLLNTFLTDINIQFEKEIEYKNENIHHTAYVVKNLPRNKQIVDISLNSFKYSRFFNDPKLPFEKARNIYLHWTECAFDKENKYFVVSEIGGEIAGYLLFSFDGDSSVIELVAVGEKYKGQKVGKSLIYTMESFVLDRGIKQIKVGTQLTNKSAVQFYNAMGFRYMSCGSIYHMWRRS